MSKSKKTKTQDSSQSTNTLDPRFGALVYGNVDRARGIADRPFQPFAGPRVAGFNPVQAEAQERMTDLSRAGAGAQSLAQATGAASRAASFAPLTVSGARYAPSVVSAAQARPFEAVAAPSANFERAEAQGAGPASLAQATTLGRGEVRDVTTGPITPDAIAAYADPHRRSVIDAALKDIERQRLVEDTRLRQKATLEKAFGGTGSAVERSLAGEDFNRLMGRTTAELHSQGWQSALSAAQADAARRLQADAGNQAVDLDVASANAGFRQQAGLANAGATNQRAEFDAANRQQAALSNRDAANRNAEFNAGLAGETGRFNAAGAQDSAQFNAQLSQQAGLADAAARTDAARFGAEQDWAAQTANQQAGLAAAGLNLEGAGLLAGLSDQERRQALEDVNLLGQVGDARRDLSQAEIDAAYEAHLLEQEHPYRGQALVNQAIGMVPQTGTVNTASSGMSKTTERNPLGTAAAVLQTVSMSDARLKTDIETAGEDRKGRRWVDFRYLWDRPGTRRRGLLAQETLATDPQAVDVQAGGLLTIDYGALK